MFLQKTSTMIYLQFTMVNASLAMARSLRPPPRSEAGLNQRMACWLISLSDALLATWFFRTASVKRESQLVDGYKF